ncbi:MAG: hypothetical protein LBE80_07915 [Deltaproteobacteria bacterium]|jgi:hypothetical protein|nr:hypothetical protein [Deltaproteobacteria bacterium]
MTSSQDKAYIENSEVYLTALAKQEKVLAEASAEALAKEKASAKALAKKYEDLIKKYFTPISLDIPLKEISKKTKFPLSYLSKILKKKDS